MLEVASQRSANMKKPKVYIETTIPSFYFEVREQPEMVARRIWTQQWWNDEREKYELVTSIAVLEELERGGHPRKPEVLELATGLPLLSVDTEIDAIVQTYIERGTMPRDPRGDALHLALASFHRCQFLLTWNCAHLANANKFEHIRYVTDYSAFLYQHSQHQWNSLNGTRWTHEERSGN